MNSLGGDSGSLEEYFGRSAASGRMERIIHWVRHGGWRTGSVGKPAICSASTVGSTGSRDYARSKQPLSLHPPRHPAPSRLASGMGFSDTVAGLVDRLKPSNKPTSFSGIGSGNHGIVSFEDDVSPLPPTCRQRVCRISHLVSQLTIRFLR